MALSDLEDQSAAGEVSEVTHWKCLQHGQNLHFGKVIKCCMDVLCTSVKLYQICKFWAVNCTKMRLAAGSAPQATYSRY